MKATQVAPFGGPVDVACHNGRVVLAWQSGKDRDVRLVVAEIDPVSHATLLSYSLALGDDVGAFPRLLSASGSLWCIYREGASKGGRAVLLRDGREVWRSPWECGGNNPVCFGAMGLRPAFAAQMAGPENMVFAGQLSADPSLGVHRIGTGAADGIASFNDEGGITLVKDLFVSVPGMTRPSWAFDLVAGEHPDSGVLVRAGDGRELRLWPGEETVAPRLTHDYATGTYAVVTSGVRNGVDYGVRIATFTASEMQAQAPPVEPDAPFPPGKGWTRRDDITEIDVADYLLGAEWARDGMHVAGDAVTYSHPFQARSGPGWVQHTKFAPPDTRAATWTITDQWIGLAFDGTNELSAGYRMVLPGTTQTAALYPRRMQVGPQHRRVLDLEILDLKTQTRRAVTFAGWVEAVYDGPQIGNLPPTTHAVIMFDPASTDSRGWREQNIGAKGRGCWYWHQVRKAAGASPDMRWMGTKHAPRVVDPMPRYADALPVAVPVVVPIPDPDPEDDMKIWQYNDADAVRVIDFLELKYTTPTEQNGLGRDKVDNLGYARWLHDAVRLLDGGWTVDRVLFEINKRINAIVGLPGDAWPGGGPVTPPVPDQPVPRPSRLIGPLRIAADKSAFLDNTGPVLPVVCHLGDGLSRWTRDPGGVGALLDDIAAAGYDGVRTWTVLGGSSYWNGREVGPMYQGNYFDHVQAFADALRRRGLRWLVSQGDAMRLLPTTPERQAFMRSLAERLDLELVAGVDAGNELLWNGETDSSRMRVVVEAFRAVRQAAVWSLTSPGGEEQDDLDTFSGSVFDVHGYRGGRSWDKLRHIFSIAYEQKPSARLGVQSEWAGPGDLVSAIENKHEMTAGVLQLACALSLMARQLWVYFSGPGVKSDAGERLQDMPGFRETCAIRDALPADLMTFGSLVHGGASQKGRRVFAVPGTDETRADHAIHADGRFVAAVYGPRWRDVTQEKTCRIERRIDCGDDGYVIVGRLS